jgi:hypothetical protein
LRAIISIAVSDTPGRVRIHHFFVSDLLREWHRLSWIRRLLILAALFYRKRAPGTHLGKA